MKKYQVETEKVDRERVELVMDSITTALDQVEATLAEGILAMQFVKEMMLHHHGLLDAVHLRVPVKPEDETSH